MHGAASMQFYTIVQSSDISAHQFFSEQLAELSANFHQYHKCSHRGGGSDRLKACEVGLLNRLR